MKKLKHIKEHEYDWNTCNMCHKDMNHSLLIREGLDLSFCTNSKCPNYKLLQIPEEWYCRD